jgi:hypothetical protein
MVLSSFHSLKLLSILGASKWKVKSANSVEPGQTAWLFRLAWLYTSGTFSSSIVRFKNFCTSYSVKVTVSPYWIMFKVSSFFVIIQVKKADTMATCISKISCEKCTCDLFQSKLISVINQLFTRINKVSQSQSVTSVNKTKVSYFRNLNMPVYRILCLLYFYLCF